MREGAAEGGRPQRRPMDWRNEWMIGDGDGTFVGLLNVGT